MSTEAPYRSTERVERDGYLVYAVGDEIPASDTAELQRQGLLPAKAEKPAANKAEAPADNKARRPRTTRAKG